MAVANTDLVNDHLYVLLTLQKMIKESDDKLLESTIQNWDDDTLLIFIRCRNYDTESVFQWIKSFVKTTRISYPKYCDEFYPSRFTSELDSGIVEILKNRDSNGRRVIVTRYSLYDTDKFELDDCFRAACIVIFQILQEIETQINGVVVIWDLRDYTFKHASQSSFSIIRRHSNIIMNAVPIKIKAVHVLNAPRIFDIVLTIGKMFISKKLSSRICSQSSLGSLHKSISPEILPNYLGGYLTEDEAFDREIFSMLKTEQKDEYFKNIFTKYKSTKK